MLNLRQVSHFCASLSENVSQASDPVKVGVAKENPLWLVPSGSHAPKTDPDVFAQLFRGNEPWADGIRPFLAHNLNFVYSSRDQGPTRLGTAYQAL